jgi:hypothetical protein
LLDPLKSFEIQTKVTMMMRLTVASFLAILSVANAYDVVSLTPENYESKTDGKTVFLKFFAPWVSFVHRHGVVSVS